MTIGYPVKCPSCGHVYYLYYQADDSIRWREWPMLLECQECGDSVYLAVSTNNGLNPKLEEVTADVPGTVVGYCGTLPTPKSLYYRDTEAPTPGANSVYLRMAELCRPYLNFMDIKKHQQQMAVLEEGIVRYRQALPQLYRMLNGPKINPKAYFRKMKSIFGDDMPGDEFSTREECIEHYMAMLATVYRGLNFGNFSESALFRLFHKLPGELIHEGPDAALDVLEKNLLSSDIRHKVYKRLNESVGELEKLLPAFFLDILPLDVHYITQDLNILTGSFETFNELYAANFEVLCKVLPLVMAVYNRVNNGDVDLFKSADGKPLEHKTLADFSALDNGMKVHLMLSLPDLKDALGDILNTKIRNGYNHVNTGYDLITQTGTYHYDPARPERSEKYRLIDVAYGVICQVRAMLMLVWWFNAFDKMKDLRREEVEE